jgi:hypothetical protein
MKRTPAFRAALITCCAGVAAAGCGTEETTEFPDLSGPYLGQNPPGATPELFAPGIVTTGMYTRDVAMTPDGNELYFGVLESGFTVIMQSTLEDGRWTEPEVAPFSRDPRFFNLEPHISPDGQRFFFLSNRPPRDADPEDDDVGRWTNEDIWVMDRTDEGWSEPYNLGPPVNTEGAEFFPSVTRDGTLYFTRGETDPAGSAIYRSRFVDGQYTEPERLGPEVNSTPSQYNAFVAPDESYLIVPTDRRDDSFGSSDYYIVFRDEDDTWSEPVNMGEEVNTAFVEMSPYVSPDGKYFFFMSTRRIGRDEWPERLTSRYLRDRYENPGNGNAGIYWVDAGFIERLRQ